MGMIINPYLVQPSGPSYGTLTTAWIAATGETDTTILGALNTLETDLTTYGLTAKMKALYPFVGGTSTKHSYNFMNTAQYQLTFYGGWTHSTGSKPNGTNGYATTGIYANNFTADSQHMSNYSRQITNTGGTEIGFISYDSPNKFNYVMFQHPTSNVYAAIQSSDSLMDSTNDAGYGLIISNRRNNTNIQRYYRNTKTEIVNVGNGLGTKQIYLSAIDGANTFGTCEIAFGTVGDGLTDTEASNFYTAVQTFQTTLGRQVGVPIVSDADAQAFLNAAVITDTTQASAVNTLVTGLKADGLWTKMKAIYPFVGGTASTHKWNLKNPVDSDAAFRLVFNGGWTHSATGALPGGVNGYANTYYNLSSQSTTSNISAGFYSRVNSLVAGADFGGSDNSDNGTQLFLKYTNNITYWSANDYSTAGSGIIISDTRGLFVLNKISLSEKRIYQNGSQIHTAVPINNTAPNNNIVIGARKLGASAEDQFSNREHSFTFFGDTLTDTDVANFYTRVQTYQTALSRNV